MVNAVTWMNNKRGASDGKRDLTGKDSARYRLNVTFINLKSNDYNFEVFINTQYIQLSIYSTSINNRIELD